MSKVAEKLRMAVQGGFEGSRGLVINNARVLFNCTSKEHGTLFRLIADEIEREGKSRKQRLYAYALADQMTDHEFSDDVAICWAKSKKKAIKKFRQLYGNADETNVCRVRFNDYGVAILTDY